MKTKISYSLLAAAMACGMAQGQTTAYTTPVGYVTQALNPNQFTLAGLTVHNPTVAAGVLDAVSAAPNTVTDTQTNFTTLLTAGATYILELTNGSGVGTIQEVTAWTGSVLTTPSSIVSLVTPGTTTFKLRKAATVSDVFGAANTLGLTPSTDGDPTLADKILIPNATNGLDTVFYFNDGAGNQGWLDTESNLAADKPMVYADGFYVQRGAGAPKSLVISGEIKTLGTKGVLLNGFNYLSGVAPAGLTLDNSGLANSISQSADGDPSTVDNVLLPTPSGGVITAFYFNDGAGNQGWLDTESNLAGAYPIDGGFLIQNRGTTKPYSLSVPTSFNSL